MARQAMDILAVFVSFPSGCEAQDVDLVDDLARGGILEVESEDQELVVFFSLN